MASKSNAPVTRTIAQRRQWHVSEVCKRAEKVRGYLSSQGNGADIDAHLFYLVRDYANIELPHYAALAEKEGKEAINLTEQALLAMVYATMGLPISITEAS